MTYAIWERRYKHGKPTPDWFQYKTSLSPEEANALMDHKTLTRKKAGIEAEFVVLPEDETPYRNITTG